jgi:hypothetical protein
VLAQTTPEKPLQADTDAKKAKTEGKELEDDDSDSGPERLTPERSKALTKKTRTRWDRRPHGQRSEAVRGFFRTPLAISQKHEMHPTLRKLAEAVKAVEHYNEHARFRLRRLDEEMQNLEAKEIMEDRQPALTRKLMKLGERKHSLLLRRKIRSEPQLAPRKIPIKGFKCISRKGTDATPDTSSKVEEVVQGVRAEPHTLGSRVKRVTWDIPDASEKPIRARPPPPPPPPVTSPSSRGNLGGSTVDRSRDPRLRGR